MDLTGARIEGEAASIRVMDGAIAAVHHDRRKRATEPSDKWAKRRKKAPGGLEELVGTGLIWVATGHLSLRAADLAAWKPGPMRLIMPTRTKTVQSELVLYVVTLRPQDPLQRSVLAKSKRDSWSSWTFKALMVPNQEQLDLLPVVLEPKTLATRA